MRHLFFILMLALTLSACASDRPLETGCTRIGDFQYPKANEQALALGQDNGFGEIPITAFKQPERLNAANERGALTPQYSDALLLSGGGQWGAYGAGVLKGWSANGRLPARLVTGISTGALQSTFAYLGPQYDDRLVDAYSINDERQLVIRHGSTFFLTHGSTADIAPAKDYIKARVGPLLDAVKAEYLATGRQLFVGAVDGLSGRFYVFDLTRMASELESNERLDCYTAALLASASVPVVFRQTTINGKPWLDGGLRHALFLPAMIRQMSAAKAQARAQSALVPTDGKVYALKNGIIKPEAVETLPAKLLPTIGRLRTIVFNQLEQDSLDIAGVYAHQAGLRYYTTTADGWELFGPCHGHESGEEDRIFDPGFMRCMIAFGQSKWEPGKSPWTEQTTP